MYYFVWVSADRKNELPLKAPVEFLSKTMVILTIADIDKAKKYARILKSRDKSLGTYEVRVYLGSEPTIEKYW